MASRLLRGALALLPLAVASTCASASPIKVVLLGDSITVGESSQPTGPGYATLLADALGSGVEIANVACAGASSIDWSPSGQNSFCGDEFALPSLYLGRARPALPSDLVVVLLGTNDATGGFEPEQTSAERYHDVILELATALLADGAKAVMLLTPPPYYDVIPTQVRLFKYRDEILALCGAPDDAILCGPDAFLLLQPEDFATGDPHPNARGHQKLADALRAAVVAALQTAG